MVGRRAVVALVVLAALGGAAVGGAAVALDGTPGGASGLVADADDAVTGVVDSFGGLASDARDGRTGSERPPPPADTEPPVEHGIDKPVLEQEIHDRINVVRADHNLTRLAFDTELRNVSRYHSRDMARNEYFAHTAPDGETLEDRYELYGYECRVETDSGYATGGENLFVLKFDRVAFSESQIAEQAVEGWMRSPGHRRNILRPYWEHEAIGVDVVERDGTVEVYVTQHFC